MVKVTSICPACQFENKARADKCARCGVELDTTSKTIEVPKAARSKTPVPPLSSMKDAEMIRGSLVLFALDQQEPIVLPSEPEVVLGRNSTNGPQPTVDLTPYDAVNLGVSRRHAIIRCVDGAFTLEDQDSANGTWLNEEAVKSGTQHPLKSTDYVRLGNLKLFVYFNQGTGSLNKAQQALEKQIIVLKGSSSAEATPDYLVETVAPYCKAANDLQKLYDELLDRENKPVLIHMMKADPVLELHLKQAPALDRLLRYRKAHPLEVREKVIVGGMLVPRKLDLVEIDAATKQSAQMEFAAGWLREIAADLAEDKLSDAKQRLLPLLDRLFDAQFEAEM
jgi:pSer/pThr/pTyr-binding forkhead associated (FHA) protein